MTTRPAEHTATGSRLEQLDALRGLAALSVVIHHHLLVYPAVMDAYRTKLPGLGTGLLFLPPVYLFWAGHAAVVLFFVLSGYVLALPTLQGRQPAYWLYAVRRFCRIYIPYAIAVAGAMFAADVLARGDIPSLSSWFRKGWTVAPDRTHVLGHMLMLPTFDTSKFNEAIWSLVHEMRISLIFPLLAAAVARTHWRWCVVVAAGLSLAGVYGPQLDSRLKEYDDYGLTAHYTAMFLLGAVLAKHREWVAAKLAALRQRHFIALVGLGLLLYAADGLHPAFRVHRVRQSEWLNTAGALILIACATSAAWLRAAPLRWLGKVSYSLYLWHLPVLFATIHVGYGHAPLWLLLALSLPLTIATAGLMYRFVEAPAADLARRIGALQPRIRAQGAASLKTS